MIGRTARVRLAAAAAAVAVSAAAGCAQYEIRTASSDPMDLAYREVTMNAYFWGLVRDPLVHEVEQPDGTKSREPINDVIVVDNLGFDLLSVITLGIWKPMTIRYRVRAPSDGHTGEVDLSDEPDE